MMLLLFSLLVSYVLFAYFLTWLATFIYRKMHCVIGNVYHIIPSGNFNT